MYYMQCQLLMLAKRQVSYLVTKVNNCLTLLHERNNTVLVQQQRIEQLEHDLLATGDPPVAMARLKIDKLHTDKSEESLNSLITGQQMNLTKCEEMDEGINLDSAIDTLFEGDTSTDFDTSSDTPDQQYRLEELEMQLISLQDHHKNEQIRHQLIVTEYERKVNLNITKLEAYESMSNVQQRRIGLLESRLSALLNDNPSELTDTLSGTSETNIPTKCQDMVEKRRELRASPKQFKLDKQTVSPNGESIEKVCAEREKYKNDFKEITFMYSSLMEETERLQRLANTNYNALRERENVARKEQYDARLETKQVKHELEAKNKELEMMVADLKRELEYTRTSFELKNSVEQPASKNEDIAPIFLRIEDRQGDRSEVEQLTRQIETTMEDYNEIIQYIEELDEIQFEGEACLERVRKIDPDELQLLQCELTAAQRKAVDLQLELDSTQAQLTETTNLLKSERIYARSLEKRVGNQGAKVNYVNMWRHDTGRTKVYRNVVVVVLDEIEYHVWMKLKHILCTCNSISWAVREVQSSKLFKKKF